MIVRRLILRLIDLSGLNAWSRRRHRGRIRALLYHNIMPDDRHFDYAITPEQFDRHIRHLKRHYNLIGLDQAGEWIGYRPDRVNVLLTFDDGFHNNFSAVMPILKHHAVPGVFFLITDCIERGEPPPFIVARLGDAASDPAYRTVNAMEARAMMEDGATIASHSRAHADHRAMSVDTDVAEGEAARFQLERAIGAPVTSFAFPWGHHRPGQDEAFTRIYRRVFLTRHGFCDRQDRIIPRNEVADLAHLKAVASGAIDLIRAHTRASGVSVEATSPVRGPRRPMRAITARIRPLIARR